MPPTSGKSSLPRASSGLPFRAKNANVFPSLSSPMNNWSKGISWTCCSSHQSSCSSHPSSCLRVSSSLRAPLLARTLLRLVTSHVPRPTPCLDCLFSFSVHELLSPRCSWKPTSFQSGVWSSWFAASIMFGCVCAFYCSMKNTSPSIHRDPLGFPFLEGRHPKTEHDHVPFVPRPHSRMISSHPHPRTFPYISCHVECTPAWLFFDANGTSVGLRQLRRLRYCAHDASLLREAINTSDAKTWNLFRWRGLVVWPCFFRCLHVFRPELGTHCLNSQKPHHASHFLDRELYSNPYQFSTRNHKR